MKVLYSQNFNIDNKNIIGKIEKHDDDLFTMIYLNGKLLKKKMYNGELNDLAILAEMESFIEE